MKSIGILLIIFMTSTYGADILMITMGGTKSHKIPFWELSKGLISRGHNVTFLNGFPVDFILNGLHEITPSGLVEYIQNYTNWDLLGARMKGQEPISYFDMLRYPIQSCDAMLHDAETKDLLYRTFDLAILDGAFPECALGLVYKYKIPFMYINTVGFYTGSLSLAGNPTPFSVTPVFYGAFTDNMNLYQRISNVGLHLFANLAHRYLLMPILNSVLRQHFGSDIPHVYDISRNVSFILQNGHASVSYPRALLPNVAEIACIHCKPAKPLPLDLEEFIQSSGEIGFIYVSMGSSVKTANMPEELRKMLIKTFAQLPYNILWKWDGDNMQDLPVNVKLSRWLPQQDILGHRKLRAFITHGGLLSMYEAVYHAVPLLAMPVFCDQDSNTAKAETDGYALILQLNELTSEKLYKSIIKVIHDPSYRQNAKYRQQLLLDQRTAPLETAVYWTEYVLRHKGAYHLQTPGRNLSWIQYYLIDIVFLLISLIVILRFTIKRYSRQQVIISLNKKQKNL